MLFPYSWFSRVRFNVFCLIEIKYAAPSLILFQVGPQHKDKESLRNAGHGERDRGQLKAASWSHSTANHRVRVKGVSPTVRASDYERPGRPFSPGMRGRRGRISSLLRDVSPSPLPLNSSRLARRPLLFTSRDFASRLTFTLRGPCSERVILRLSFSRLSSAFSLSLSLSLLLFSLSFSLTFDPICVFLRDDSDDYHVRFNYMREFRISHVRRFLRAFSYDENNIVAKIQIQLLIKILRIKWDSA